MTSTFQKGPNTAKLPKGFAKDALKQATSPEGLLRVYLVKLSGQQVRWGGYLRQIGGPTLKLKMLRDAKDGRCIRYWLLPV